MGKVGPRVPPPGSLDPLLSSLSLNVSTVWPGAPSASSAHDPQQRAQRKPSLPGRGGWEAGHTGEQTSELTRPPNNFTDRETDGASERGPFSVLGLRGSKVGRDPQGPFPAKRPGLFGGREPAQQGCGRSGLVREQL